ncbi:MAG: ABC transporter ATP-binding protein [Acidimicrobiales bacterium]
MMIVLDAPALAPNPSTNLAHSDPRPDTAIDIAGVSKTYQGQAALVEVSFSVPTGSVCGLIGPNGAGKSTLLRVLLGLIQADEGSARIVGRTYRELDRPAERIGVVIDGTGVNGRDSARSHLRRVARYLGLPKERVDEVLEGVGLAYAADRRSGKYSLGMGQRLALASALLPRPGILILDEPSNGLDPEGMHWLRSMLRRFANDGGTVLVSSHHLLDLQQVVDDVVILNQHVRFTGTLDELGVDRNDAGALEARFLTITGGSSS